MTVNFLKNSNNMKYLGWYHMEGHVLEPSVDELFVVLELLNNVQRGVA